MQSDRSDTTIRVLGYDLTGKVRADGSTYYTCSVLPGFHYILERDHAGIGLTLAPALSKFLHLYETARAKLT